MSDNSVTTLPPQPFPINFLERYILILQRFQHLLCEVLSAGYDLDEFLAVAEYRYTLYLDLLAQQADDESIVLPPWDVAVIWHAHLMCPADYLGDVLYRPAYSSVPKLKLDFPAEALSLLIDKNTWSDARSVSIWESLYPDEPYDTFTPPPWSRVKNSDPALAIVYVKCPRAECRFAIPFSGSELERLPFQTDQSHCSECESRFSFDDICFENLKRDWRKALADDGRHAATAIKGAVVSNNGNRFTPEVQGARMREWAADCLVSAGGTTPPSNIGEALERLKKDLELGSDRNHWNQVFQEEVKRSYSINIWPNISLILPDVVKSWPDVHSDFIASSSNSVRTDTESVIDVTLLSQAMKRYLKYTDVRKNGWELPLYRDIQLVRNAHRLSPNSFHRWCEDHVGTRLVYNYDLIADPAQMTREFLDEVSLRTIDGMCTLWKERFNEPYTSLPAQDGSTYRFDTLESNVEQDYLVRRKTECTICRKCQKDDTPGVRSRISRWFTKDRTRKSPSIYSKSLRGTTFRLLRFQYKCSRGSLHYGMREYDFADNMDYMAISYTWVHPYLDEQTGEIDETPSEAYQVFVNGVPHLVKANAYACMDRLRLHHADQNLWMDCICINQEDEEEKSSQVMQMDRIFAGASYVFVWLGPYNHLADDFRWACTTLEIRVKDLVQGIGIDALPPFNDTEFWATAGVPDAYNRFRNAVIFSAICRWFTRIWTIQEVVLAKRIYVLCGSVQLPWTGIEWLAETFSTDDQISQEILVPEVFRWSPSICQRALQIGKLRGPLVRDAFPSLPCDEKSLFVMHLLELAQRFRDSKCHDQRDKVWALLGITRAAWNVSASLVAELIPVDYKTMSWKDVYHNLAKTALEQLRCPIFLGYVQVSEQHLSGNLADIPTWLPDFSISLNLVPLHTHLSEGSGPFSVWLESQHLGAAKIKQDELLLQGVKIDDVAAICEAEGGDSPCSAFMSYMELAAAHVSRKESSSRAGALLSTLIARDIGKFADSTSVGEAKRLFFAMVELQFASCLYIAQNLEHGDHGNLKDRVLTILQIFDEEIRRGEIPGLDQVVKFSAILSLAKNHESPEPERNEAIAMATEAQVSVHSFQQLVEKWRALFLTKAGAMGCGPQTMDPDLGTDEVWVFPGFPVPLVLRRFENCHAKTKTFKVLGECYLHEYMHGELIEDDPDIAQKLESIVLV